ncbi:MAG: hypothetical protein ACI8UP_002892 [Porticoccaceae bacterium]|jgi:hypothetical protein
MQDKDFMVSFFDKRIKEIKRTIAPERLLVFHVKEGWGPLCKFLGVPVPPTDFPRINSREETKEIIANMRAASDGKVSDEAMIAAGRKMHEE